MPSRQSGRQAGLFLFFFLPEEMSRPFLAARAELGLAGRLNEKSPKSQRFFSTPFMVKGGIALSKTNLKNQKGGRNDGL